MATLNHGGIDDGDDDGHGSNNRNSNVDDEGDDVRMMVKMVFVFSASRAFRLLEAPRQLPASEDAPTGLLVLKRGEPFLLLRP